jgi:hypothetical protein
MKLVNVTLPTATKFGTFQIEGMDATYFRFDYVDGCPVLEHDFFVVAEREANNRQHPMDQTMYDNLQRTLLEHVLSAH